MRKKKLIDELANKLETGHEILRLEQMRTQFFACVELFQHPVKP